MYYVYILQCADGSFYIGFTEHLEARVKEHSDGTLGAAHTFLRRPVTLVYSETFASQDKAIKRERQLKGWSHAKRAALEALSKRRRA